MELGTPRVTIAALVELHSCLSSTVSDEAPRTDVIKRFSWLIRGQRRRMRALRS